MSLINFKTKKGNSDLSSQDIQMLVHAIRAAGRLSQKPGGGVRFEKEGGLDKMNEILSGHGDDQVVANAVMDAIQNLATTKDGEKIIVDSGIMLTSTKVLKDNVHADYAIMMQKYGDLVKQLTIQDRTFMQALIDGGMLDAIRKAIVSNYDDPDTMMATADLIKDLGHLHPYLASGLAKILQKD